MEKREEDDCNIISFSFISRAFRGDPRRASSGNYSGVSAALANLQGKS
jgi:hypothetical protein